MKLPSILLSLSLLTCATVSSLTLPSLKTRSLLFSTPLATPSKSGCTDTDQLQTINDVNNDVNNAQNDYSINKITTIRGGGSRLTSFGTWYSTSLETSPLLTKTLTSLLLMTLSFYVGQSLSPSPLPSPFKLKTSPLFLLLLFPGLYFPLTSHYYYIKINQLIPGRDISSVIKKSLIGQLSYGPIYTSIFFLSQLIPSTPSDLNFLKSVVVAFKDLLPGKMLRDFLPVWRSGIMYWGVVDILSFKFVPTQWITGFVNLASFFWTVILCVVARG
mmetsp:Transcript_12744/g.23305  ORF Transcript_12744/g.23305 Transcript_12744/m.23305 type:complete len:273 (+) Transcript_12744:23-841(+)